MPTVTPNSPSEFTPFGSEEEHVRAHRGLERSIENIEVATVDTLNVNTMTVVTLAVSGTATVNTISAVSLVATLVGLGGATPNPATTLALIKGFHRTAAPIAISVPAMTMLGVTTVSSVHIFSVERQMGNAVQVGDPVILVPTTAIPANVGIGGVTVVDTNSIQITYVGRGAAIVTATFTVHIFSPDLT